MDFLNTWLPNIVCMIVGFLISWIVGYRQGKRATHTGEKHTLMLENLLVAAEKQGLLKLGRDKNGIITGGTMIVLEIPTGTITLTGHAPTITQSPPPTTS